MQKKDADIVLLRAKNASLEEAVKQLSKQQHAARSLACVTRVVPVPPHVKSSDSVCCVQHQNLSCVRCTTMFGRRYLYLVHYPGYDQNLQGHCSANTDSSSLEQDT